MLKNAPLNGIKVQLKTEQEHVHCRPVSFPALHSEFKPVKFSGFRDKDHNSAVWKSTTCCSATTLMVCMQSEAESIAEAAMGEEADGDETEEVDEEDGLNGDTVWDPDHATPWRPRRSRRNTSQLTARQPSRSLLERVRHLSQAFTALLLLFLLCNKCTGVVRNSFGF